MMVMMMMITCLGTFSQTSLGTWLHTFRGTSLQTFGKEKSITEINFKSQFHPNWKSLWRKFENLSHLFCHLSWNILAHLTRNLRDSLIFWTFQFCILWLKHCQGTTDSRHWVLWVNQHLLSILTNPTSQVSQQGVTEARQWSDLGSIKCKMQNANASEYGKIGRGRSWLGYYLLHISSRSRREISASKSTWIKLPPKENHFARDCLLGC